MPADWFIVHQPTTVYARPDRSSFDWARLPRGIYVQLLRSEGDWSHVEYVEHRHTYSDPEVTYQILGWVRSEHITNCVSRHFFHLKYSGAIQDNPWVVHTDNHDFSVYWANRDELTQIQDVQLPWVSLIPPVGT